MSAPRLSIEYGLPSDLEAEKCILAQAMKERRCDIEVLSGTLAAEDFTLEKHRRIFSAMVDIAKAGEAVDRITVFSELTRRGQAESCDGLGYLLDLDNNIPDFVSIDSYIHIVKEKATLRKLIYASQNFMARCLNGESSEEVLTHADATLRALGEAGTKSEWLRPGEIVERYPGGVGAFLNPSRGGNGVALPWASLTQDLCGLHKGDLFLVAGRPSHGKSICLMQMAYHAASQGHDAAVISLEMSSESLIRRLVCAIGRVDAQKMRAGYLNADERMRALRTVDLIKSVPMFIDDSHQNTMPEITAALRKLASNHPLRVIFVDYLQLIRSVVRGQNKHLELSEISKEFKNLANKMEVTVVLLCQLNRECEKEKRAPRLSDLAECGSLEADADVVMFVHRPEMYHRDREDLRAVAEFIIGKQRHGATGKRRMVFLAEFQKFEMTANDMPDVESTDD